MSNSGSCCGGGNGQQSCCCNRLYPSQTRQIEIPANFTPAQSLIFSLPYCTAPGCDNLALTADDFVFVGLCLRQRSTGFVNILDVNGPDGVLPPTQAGAAYFAASVENVTPSHITVRIQTAANWPPGAPFVAAAASTLCLEYWATCAVEPIGCCPDPQLVVTP